MSAKKNTQKEGYNNTFPTRLRQKIKENQTTQAALSEYLGKSRQAVSFYADGTASPDVESILKIAKFLNTSTDYLLGMTDEDTPDQDILSVCEFTGLSSYTIERLHKTKRDDGFNFLAYLLDNIVADNEQNLIYAECSIGHAVKARIAKENEPKKELTMYPPVLLGDDGIFTITAEEAEKFHIESAKKHLYRLIDLTLEGAECEYLYMVENYNSLNFPKSDL